MKEMKYHFIKYIDPGHGWLRAPGFLMRELKYTVDSMFSFYDKLTDSYYLEEDCDAPAFIKFLGGYEEVHIQDEFLDDEATFIRSLPRCSELTNPLIGD